MEKEKVTEELVRQNGNQAAAVMADFAGGGGSGGAITPPIDPVSGVAKFTSLPEAGKIYNIPFPNVGILVPVYIAEIHGPSEDEPLTGSCYFCTFLGESAYSLSNNTEISWDGTGVTDLPTLNISEEGDDLKASILVQMA